MAYFKNNDGAETRRNPVVPEDQESGTERPVWQDAPEGYDYDDGLDESDEGIYEEELTEEEKKEIRKGRIQVLFGTGNLTSIIIGAVLILLLLFLLVWMIDLVTRKNPPINIDMFR